MHTLHERISSIASHCVGGLWFSFVLGLSLAYGQEASPDGGVKKFTPDQGTLSSSGKFEPKTKPGGTATAEPTIQIEKDVVKIGRVEVRRDTREVIIPAKVQMREGTIEYLLVNSQGKVHESLLATDALPQDIQVACLLAGIAKIDVTTPQAISVLVTWATNGPAKEAKAETMVALKGPDGKEDATKRVMEGDWVYTGSVMDATGFAAAREGSVISLISDTAAMVGNKGESTKNDKVHMVNVEKLPAPGVPVKVHLKRVDAGK